MPTTALNNESRVKKTLLNVRVNLVFYLLMLMLTFFSRKIFLDCLGADFIGLTGTLGNILGYLNLAELGVGAAISFNLYKPLQQRDQSTIRDLVSLFGYYYRNIGCVVIVAAAVLSAFFPLIFKNDGINLSVVYFAFYSFLNSSLIGYFINYRQVVLSADQRNYVVAIYFQSANIVKIVIQMLVALQYGSYFAWIGIELSFGVLYAYILNKKIDKVYPWLKCSAKHGKAVSKQYPQILRSTKQVFVHKIKDFILTQSDQLFVFAFVSLKMVAYYGNYVLVIGKITSLLSTVLDSAGAGVGNLVAEGEKGRMFRVFWELNAIRFFIAGLVCFCVYMLINPFIVLWLGSEYLLSSTILFVLLVNQFIFITRGTVDNFNFAYGHYGDIWAAWVEGIINVTATILLGWKFGIVGILLGKTISLVPIVVFWKPLYLYREGFKESIAKYWAKTIRYYLAFAAAAVGTWYILRFVPFDPAESFTLWITYACTCAFGFGALYIMLIIFTCPGGKTLLQRLPVLKKSNGR